MATKEAIVAAMIGTKSEVEDPNTMYDLRPTNDKVVVRKAGLKTTPMGLTLPENMKGQAAVEGEVVAVGPGMPIQGSRERLPLTAKPGDKILFHKGSGTEIEINGDKFLVMHENEILVFLTPKK